MEYYYCTSIKTTEIYIYILHLLSHYAILPGRSSVEAVLVILVILWEGVIPQGSHTSLHDATLWTTWKSRGKYSMRITEIRTGNMEINRMVQWHVWSQTIHVAIKQKCMKKIPFQKIEVLV